MMRAGIGYDVHAFVDDRRLILGGVEFDFEKGLDGHSDADVLVHAIMDALLGAAALGDIGSCFPDTDPAYRDASSLKLLRAVEEMLREKGFEPVNVDATVAMERPKIAPHVDAMRANIAEALGVAVERVSVKATTTEGSGPEGRGETASAQAIAMVQERPKG